MKKRKPMPVDCVIGEAVNNYVLREGAIDPTTGPKSLGQMAPLKKLLALGLSADEAQEIDRYAHLPRSLAETEDDDPTDKTLAAVDSTLKVVAEQIANIDLEVQMLHLRKKALKRRAGILERLSDSLNAYVDRRKAA